MNKGGEESIEKWLFLRNNAFCLQKGLPSYPEYFPGSK